jgi:predicted regulator of Ras-like GTPase activity (Roadblock/LC7/MglB family)
MKCATGSSKIIDSRDNIAVGQFLDNVFCELPHIDSLFLFAPTGEMVFTSDEANRHAELPALAGSVWQGAQSVAGELKRDKLNYLALQTPSGCIAATRLKPGHILILLGRVDVRLGLVLYEMESLAGRLELVLAA